MKITIEKLPSGNVKVGLVHDSARKPIVFEVRPEELATLLNLAGVAAKVEKFTFHLELS